MLGETKQGKRVEIINSMIDKEDKTTNPPNIKNTLKGNYKYRYTSKFENL